MKSLDEALVDLYFKRIIDSKTLFAYCYDTEEVEKLLGHNNRIKSFLDRTGPRLCLVSLDDFAYALYSLNRAA
jgi:hypothetical protein